MAGGQFGMGEMRPDQPVRAIFIAEDVAVRRSQRATAVVGRCIFGGLQRQFDSCRVRPQQIGSGLARSGLVLGQIPVEEHHFVLDLDLRCHNVEGSDLQFHPLPVTGR